MFDFDKIVIKESYTQPVIVEFSAPGCGPCLWMEKTLIDVVRNIKDKVHFVSLPITDCTDCVDTYKIKSNPTTIFFSNGHPIATLRGALPKMVVEQWIEDNIKLIGLQKT